MARHSLPGSPRRPELSSYIHNISPRGRGKQYARIMGVHLEESSRATFGCRKPLKGMDTSGVKQI